MWIYVDTNFLLELVYEQEQHGSVGELLTLAERGAVTLHVPAFSVAEAVSSVFGQIGRRRSVYAAVVTEARELRRSTSRRSIASNLIALADDLSTANDADEASLIATISRVLALGPALPLDAAVDSIASRYRSTLSLSLPDAMVLASTVTDLERQPVATAGHLFLSRDAKAFDAPAIRTELRRVGCVYVGNFDHAVRRVTASVLGGGPADEPPP